MGHTCPRNTEFLLLTSFDKFLEVELLSQRGSSLAQLMIHWLQNQKISEYIYYQNIAMGKYNVSFVIQFNKI